MSTSDKDAEREIERSVNHFLKGTTNEMVRKQIINTLASYGPKAIRAYQ